MALFTKFKKAKDAAVEHKKTTTAQEAKPAPAPYKHVPTHAAQDALSSQPTTVRPEELQARIRAARKQRANSYQPPVTVNQSIYHSCESSRSSSRANSSLGFLPSSPSTSLKDKANSFDAIDAACRQSLSLSYRSSTPMAGGRPPFPPLASQRPRPPMSSSRRSSFTKRKSPLSTVSLDEEPEEVYSSDSNASARSAQSSISEESRRSPDTKVKAVTMVETPLSTQPTPVTNSPSPANKPLVTRKAKWSLLSRRSIDIAAH